MKQLKLLERMKHFEKVLSCVSKLDLTKQSKNILYLSVGKGSQRVIDIMFSQKSETYRIRKLSIGSRPSSSLPAKAISSPFLRIKS